jgi:hypothetical protein
MIFPEWHAYLIADSPMQTSLAVDDVKIVRERAELKHVALQV